MKKFNSFKEMGTSMGYKTSKPARRGERMQPRKPMMNEYLSDIVFAVQNNLSLRRFVGLAIGLHLLKTNEIKEEINPRNGKPYKPFISFAPTKFSVTYNGLSKDYRYDVPYFLPIVHAAMLNLTIEIKYAMETYFSTTGKSVEIKEEEASELIKEVYEYKSSVDSEEGLEG